MAEPLTVTFAALAADLQQTTVVFAGAELSFGATLDDLDARADGALRRAAAAGDFRGKAKSALEILAPSKLSMRRLIVVGCGAAAEATADELVRLGGYALGQVLGRKAERASIVADLPGLTGRKAAEAAAEIAQGALLRRYEFRKYRTSKRGEADDDGESGKDGLEHVVIHCSDPEAARQAFATRKALADGVLLARDLVNEPANILGTVEFANRAAELAESGVEITVLDEKAIADLKMGALLGVAQGSVRPPRIVVMQWNGSKSKRSKPVCFVGKGVVFDTGGISIKPAGGMEDMKGDMAGAACVTGLMLALARRRANVNAVGLIGVVENMPSASAQRPGDIVTSMSGQTIEVINTDAEGRLVLADVIWYAQQEFKPKLIVDLATLTGAIIVSLGKEHAGLFCNDDKLAADLLEAGEATGETVWRMPLGRAYDKLIDSKTADMKNIGGRYGGAITGAQFIQRFVKDTPWAHLDVAGVAMDSARNDINQSWASGWGVRLLDRFVAENHEK